MKWIHGIQCCKHLHTDLSHACMRESLEPHLQLVLHTCDWCSTLLDQLHRVHHMYHMQPPAPHAPSAPYAPYAPCTPCVPCAQNSQNAPPATCTSSAPCGPCASWGPCAPCHAFNLSASYGKLASHQYLTWHCNCVLLYQHTNVAALDYNNKCSMFNTN